MDLENLRSYRGQEQGSPESKKIYSLPSKPSKSSGPSKSSESIGPKRSEGIEKPEITDRWGAYQKMDMKIFSKGTKDRGVQSKTRIYEKEGKDILKKYFGTGFIQKSRLKKAIMGLEVKSRHSLTEKEGKEARKHLSYIREIEKSLGKK